MFRSVVSLTSLTLLATAAVVFACFSAAHGQDSEGKEPEADTPAPEAEVKQAPRLIDARQYRIGELIEDVAFTDLAGVAGKLSDFKGSTLVVVTTNTTCPLCKRFMPTLAEIEKRYGEKGVKFLFVNFTEGETVESAKKCVEAAGFKSRYALDPKAEIGRALRALTTTDTWVLDGSRTLRYRGAVDDQFGIGYVLDKPRQSYLTEAIDSVLAGTSPLIRATWAPG